MVDTLVSGASASRRVGSTPISGTNLKTDVSNTSHNRYLFLAGTDFCFKITCNT